MTIIPADQFATLSPAALRLAEAQFVLEKFSEASLARHNDTLFLLTTYFDAFLFCFVSIEEMVESPEKKTAIQAIPIFSFLKALRNIATHHSILSGVNGKFPRPIVRIVSIGAPDNAVFCVIPEKIEFIFSEILKIRPREKRTIDTARLFLDSRIAIGGDILLKELLFSAIESVRPHVS
ncbi:MAG: hypothetical protein CVV16_05440 [Gammaproteobacteria bacterium HGW-Gammaproteobacteria-6]|nr:MAG: hypothetical protein CVV16_05440 [Gammaproteobacteria bacterium HGW-Gammaproteobacteria-6]